MKCNHPYPDFDGSSSTPLLMLGHGWVIPSHSFIWMWLLTHVPHSMLFQFISVGHRSAGASFTNRDYIKKSSWIKAWISNYIHVQQRDLITHPCPNFSSSLVNSLRLSDAIWWERSGSTLAQVMACCLMAPSHYLNQCWLIIKEVLWQSYDSNITRDTSAIYY